MARMTTGLQPACRSCPTGFLMAVRGDGGPACRAMAPDPHTAFGASNQEWTTIDGNPSRQPRRRLLTRLRHRLHAVVRVQWERGLLFRELPEIQALVATWRLAPVHSEHCLAWSYLPKLPDPSLQIGRDFLDHQPAP